MSWQITVVIPWFGRWPFWLPFYLESCRANPEVRWVLYTDCPVPDNCPDNVVIRRMSFPDYQRLVSERLGIDFRPASAYKLCDLKPALGYIHADELTESRFFAFGDIDVIYGDLVGYFRAAMERYDCISTHATRISGHFCLLRNTPELRAAFMRIPGWRGLLEDPEHRFMDEKHFSKIFRRGKNLPAPLRRFFALFNRYQRRALFREEYTTPCPVSRIQWINGNDDLPAAWHWCDGKVYSCQTGERAFPYLHFYEWKRSEWKRLPESALAAVAPDASGGWRITAQGFRPPDGELA